MFDAVGADHTSGAMATSCDTKADGAVSREVGRELIPSAALQPSKQHANASSNPGGRCVRCQVSVSLLSEGQDVSDYPLSLERAAEHSQ